MNLRSSVSGVVWPAVLTGEAATLMAMARELDRTQWWKAEEIEARQRDQLAALLAHARATVPWYRERLRGLDVSRWREIPLLRKDDVRRRRAELLSRRVPADHGPTHEAKTSGSTGEPLRVTCTALTGLFWQSLALRDDAWHRRELQGRLVAIRSGRDAPDPLAVRELPGWGLLPPRLEPSGPATVLFHLAPIARQAEILAAKDPTYLLTYPSNARDLCAYARRRALRLPSLRAVHTYGEPLTPDVRAACRDTWGVPVHDVYSCEELGFLALQCPDHEHYHVQSESVFLEVLDERGEPVPPGGIGRVVLTSLHNWAMPLVRYDIGDLGEVGGPCPCGRGLPVLRRVLGRRRNRISLPEGRTAWPDVGAIWAAIPEVERIQLVQRGPEDIEVRFARATPLAPAEERAAASRLRAALGHPFQLSFRGPVPLPRLPNGKLETFIDARGAT